VVLEQLVIPTSRRITMGLSVCRTRLSILLRHGFSIQLSKLYIYWPSAMQTRNQIDVVYGLVINGRHLALIAAVGTTQLD
jgi:hypothetical protein